MAINVHSISGMFSKPERVFSEANHTISDQRASLKPNKYDRGLRLLQVHPINTPVAPLGAYETNRKSEFR